MEIAQVSITSPPQEILSVGEIINRIKKVILGAQSLKDVFIRGEISGLKEHNSNLYFNLKDEKAIMKCLIWSNTFIEMGCGELKEGDKVVLGGDVSFYENRSEVQLHVRDCQFEGVGKLYKQYVDMKAKLLSEGLFAPERKLPIPAFPQRVGIVTSNTGEAKNDILRILKMGPSMEIIIEYTRVQGDGAAAELSEAITRLDEKVEVIIVGRGGGSIEDLWAFNDEGLARTIANSKTPIISAVGHETDEVLSDFVADCRAQTPTDAANIIVCKMNDLVRSYSLANEKLYPAIWKYLWDYHQILDSINIQRQKKMVCSTLELSRKDLEHTENQFENAAAQRLTKSRNLCENLTSNLNLIGTDLKRRDERRNRLQANYRKMGLVSTVSGISLLLITLMLDFETSLKVLLDLIGFVMLIIGVFGLTHVKKETVVNRNTGVEKMSSFEKTVERLKEIVKELERDNIPLERALGLYEEGVILSKTANDFLAKAEHKITELGALG